MMSCLLQLANMPSNITIVFLPAEYILFRTHMGAHRTKLRRCERKRALLRISSRRQDLPDTLYFLNDVHAKAFFEYSFLQIAFT